MKKIILAILLIIIVLAGYFVIRSNTSMTNIPANRVAYTGNGVQFYYPPSFGANVWRVDQRPPVVSIVPTGKDALAIGCPLLQNAGIPLNKREGKINNLDYTLYTGSDIGAWTVYTSMCYVFSGEHKNYVVDFEVRSHSWCGNGNCWAYCETANEQECKDFELATQVTKPIEMIIKTFKIVK